VDLGAVAFYVVATATVVASLGVVLTRSVVYSALLLIASLALTGFVYLLLLSDFLALVQILVYGGTVSILLLFALMLTRPREAQVMNHRGWPLAALGSVVALAGLVVAVTWTDWAALTPRASAPVQRLGPEEIGTALFTVWAVPFEIASVVLLVALVGSLLVARATETEAAEEMAVGTGTRGGAA
jgi:NADH-quinone oxidoreductase subunit J